MESSQFLKKVNPASDAYNTVKQRMNDTISTHRGSEKFTSYILHNVYEVINPDLRKKFEARKMAIAREMGLKADDVPYATMLFHGTSPAIAMDIVKNGFKVSTADPCGIYFANKSSKSNQYAVQTLLVCNVTLGRKYCTPRAMNGITAPPNGCHSVEGTTTEGGLVYPEFVIYNDYQAFRTYVVDYSIQM